MIPQLQSAVEQAQDLLRQYDNGTMTSAREWAYIMRQLLVHIAMQTRTKGDGE